MSEQFAQQGNETPSVVEEKDRDSSGSGTRTSSRPGLQEAGVSVTFDVFLI